jgi:drug/metabolite transporter (DMT)-like permease
MSAPETATAPVREGVLSRFLRFRRGPWEWLATIIIAAGVIMLMQPLSLELYGWSFATIIVGTAMFVIVSHFPD